MWSVVTRDASGGASLTMIGRHRDDLVRENGQWKIARRRGYVDLPTAMPRSTAEGTS
jgi:SnoaL-like domain